MRKQCPSKLCIYHRHLGNDLFCPLCGSKMIDFDKVCECGKELHPVDVFCGACGKKV